MANVLSIFCIEFADWSVFVKCVSNHILLMSQSYHLYMSNEHTVGMELKLLEKWEHTGAAYSNYSNNLNKYYKVTK